MRSINKIILIGNLTRDPEMRRTPNEQYVATFGMATNREWITKDGRKQQSSEFHDIVCWGRLAEIANQYLKKGKTVYIEGYLKTRSWDDASGVKRFRTEIVAQDLIMLEKRASSGAVPTKGSLQTPVSEFNEELQPSVTMDDPLTL
jgi:single-strand DNA-binding protein